MDLWSSALVSLVLLASAAGLMTAHVRAWRAARAEPLDPRERDYRRRQFRRRMQTSAMLGLLGAAIFAGQVLTPWVGSHLFVILYWGGVLVVLGWMTLLALADIVATKFHFAQLQRDHLIEEAKLQAQLRRTEPHRQNGKRR